MPPTVAWRLRILPGPDPGEASGVSIGPNGGDPAAAPKLAVVLPGGGARGAYEIGALSVLLPALEQRGERVAVWCGTSVGAINAVLLASLAHRPVQEQVDHAIAVWLEMRRQD